MAKLVMLSGVPGSGKSYFSQTLKKVKGTHVYIISSDKLRYEMLGNQQDLTQDRVMWQIFYELPKTYSLDHLGVVLLDATHIYSKQRIEICNTLKEYYDEIDLVSFSLDKDIIANQNFQRDFPVTPEVLSSFIESYEDPSEEEKKVFSNIYYIKDNNEIASVINEILLDEDKLNLFK